MTTAAHVPVNFQNKSDKSASGFFFLKKSGSWQTTLWHLTATNWCGGDQQLHFESGRATSSERVLIFFYDPSAHTSVALRILMYYVTKNVVF